MRDGVVFVADDANAIAAASRSARSLRATDPELDTALYADDVGGVDASLFGTIRPLPPGTLSPPIAAALRAAPFDNAVYLDAHTLVCRDVRPLFEVLERFELLLVADRNAPVEGLGLPQAYPMIDLTMVGLRRTERTEALLRDWESGPQTGAALRAAVWRSDVRAVFVPPEFGFRSGAYPAFLGGPLHVLHGAHLDERTIARFTAYGRPRLASPLFGPRGDTHLRWWHRQFWRGTIRRELWFRLRHGQHRQKVSGRRSTSPAGGEG